MRCLFLLTAFALASVGCSRSQSQPPPPSQPAPRPAAKPPAEPTPPPVVEFASRRAAGIAPDASPAKTADGPDYAALIKEWEINAADKMEQRLVEIGSRIAVLQKQITAREKALEKPPVGRTAKLNAEAARAELATWNREVAALEEQLRAAEEASYGYLDPERTQPGAFGKLSGPPILRLVESVDETTSLMAWPRGRLVFWLEHSPGRPAADQDYRLSGFVHCTGFRSYTTRAGAKKSALVFKVLD